MSKGKKDGFISIKHPNGDTSLIKDGSPSVVTFKADAIDMNFGNLPAAKISDSGNTSLEGGREWVDWGENDRYPEELLDWIGKIGVAESGIDHNADLHYGAGIEWFKKEYEGGKINMIPVVVPQWNDFVSRANYTVHHSDIVQSLETFYIAFVEFILTKDRKSIYSVRSLDPVCCRFEKREDKAPPTQIYFVHDIYGSRNEKMPIPLFDKDNPTKYGKFIVPIKYRCFGMPFYAKPNFNTVIDNGWAGIAVNVPKYILSIYTNQASLKYHIKIPLSALRAEFPDYDSKTAEEKILLQEEKKANIDKAIASTERSGISVFSVFDDEMEQSISIEPIKNFLESAAELPNSFAANSEVLFSLSVDPTLLGMVPGGKGNLAGSGSDKRESRMNRQKNLKREREISLQIPRLIQKLTPGFPQDVFPAYVDADNSQTLDKNPTGTQNIVM